MYETIRKMDLQLFGEGGDGGASGAGGAEGGGSLAGVQVGDVLPDGTTVDENLANSMRENADMYRDLFQQAPAQALQQERDPNGQQAGNEADSQARKEWAEAKKKYEKYFGEDVKGAIDRRFKNHADTETQLTALQTEMAAKQQVLDAIMKKTGVASFEELQEAVNAEALEAEAEARDITVEQMKAIKEQEETMQRLQAENEQFRQAEETAKNRAYAQDLFNQAEELKKVFPDFDLEAEIKSNPRFAKALHPSVGMSVEEAYMAYHGKDLLSQSMAYGIEAGRNQTAEAVRANMMRPVEGANRGGRNGGNTAPNMENMSEDMYDAIKDRMMREGPVQL